MSTLQFVEIKELSPGEIVDHLKKSQLELVDLKMKFVTRQLEDTSLLKKKRKEIARLLTVQTQNSKEKPDKSEVKSGAKLEAKVKKATKAVAKPVKKKIENKTVAKEGKK